MDKIKKILTDHGITTREENNNLYALEEYYTPATGEHSSTWVNVTNFTTNDLANFLNY